MPCREGAPSEDHPGMKDGHTRRLTRSAAGGGFQRFLAGYQAKLVVVSGGSAGSEYMLDREAVKLGRGPCVDLAFDDPAMSRQHAIVEYAAEGFRIRDLGSTNGILVNERPVQTADINHGDRMKVGTYTFQLLVEERQQAPETYELPTEA